MADISISIVLYKNNADQIDALLQSISLTTLTYKIFFIDNSPSNELKNTVKKYQCKSIEYIFTGKNAGYGAAHNIALRKAISNYRYHIVLNPDISFGKAVLEELFTYMNLHNEVGLVVPKVLYPDGSLQYVCKLVPSPFNLIARLLPPQLFKKYNQKFELRFSGYNKIMNVPYLHGCFMFLRCSALKEIGLFDEIFFMYPEDIDLTRRMHKKYKTIFYPYVQVFHEHTKSSFKNLRMFTIHLQNIIRYFNKWGWLFDLERKKINAEVLHQLQESNT